MTGPHLTPQRWLIAAALLVQAFAVTVFFTSPAWAAGRPRPVRVMTRNLYLGADLTPAIAAQNPIELAVAASSIWQDVQATDFPARAVALAGEIESAEPILIGLQEVALWRTGVPDGPPAFGGTPAEEVALDFLQILRDELEARNLHYDVVVAQQEADLEAPTVLGFDVRLTQRDVILAKGGLPSGELKLSNALSANYAVNLSVPIAGGLGTMTSTRGWASVDVIAKRRSFRFVTTHLEVYSNFYRTEQAIELLSGPLATGMKAVVVGDLNSDPDDPVFNEQGSPFNDTNPYDLLTAQGLVDAWMQVNPLDPGFTCCNAANLLNPVPSLVRRDDYVLTRQAAAIYRSALVGIDPDGRTPAGLWPSDHAGVIASIAP